MVGYLILVLGFFRALAKYGIAQALAFAMIWFLFGMFMLGIPTLIGMLRTLGTFKLREFISGLLAQCLLIVVLYGALTLTGIQAMFNWFIIGGIIVGLTAPQNSLDKDREDRIQLNQDN